MSIKLTKRQLNTLKPETRRRYIFDAELPGFGIVVMPSGVRTFFVQYWTSGGRRGRKRRMTIGRYGPLTVDQARAIARQLLAEVAKGNDPAATRSADKAASTVRELGIDYLADVRDHRKTSTVDHYMYLWDNHIIPALGNVRVQSVTAAQVAALHRKMKQTPYLANRALALVSAFFSYAEKRSVRPRHTNPAHGLESYPEKSRERFLTPAEVKRLGEALADAVRIGLLPAPRMRMKPAIGPKAKHRPKAADVPKLANPYAVAAIRFLLLTGWREREALTLQWSYIDPVRRVAVLPDTKTGKSVRLLGAPAVELLESLPRLEGSPYVFPSRVADAPLTEINRVWYAVRHASGLDDVRLHDLRHSFASTVASAGGSLLMIRALLGHKDHTTTAKYAHLLDDPVRATADATATQLATWLGQREEASRTNHVVSIIR
jgi:integrase